MNDQLAKALCDEIIAQESKKNGFRAGPHQGKLIDIIQWARQNGATIWMILQNLQAAWIIVNDPNMAWPDKLMQIAQLFFPVNTPAINIPE